MHPGVTQASSLRLLPTQPGEAGTAATSPQKITAAATAVAATMAATLPLPASREGEVGELVRSPLCNDANYGSYITTQQPGPAAQEPRHGGREPRAGRGRGREMKPGCCKDIQCPTLVSSSFSFFPFLFFFSSLGIKQPLFMSQRLDLLLCLLLLLLF